MGREFGPLVQRTLGAAWHRWIEEDNHDEQKVVVTEQDPTRLLALKGEITARWERLPPEHQATLLLVLLDKSTWATWSIAAWVTTHQEGGKAS